MAALFFPLFRGGCYHEIRLARRTFTGPPCLCGSPSFISPPLQNRNTLPGTRSGGLTPPVHPSTTRPSPLFWDRSNLPGNPAALRLETALLSLLPTLRDKRASSSAFFSFPNQTLPPRFTKGLRKAQPLWGFMPLYIGGAAPLGPIRLPFFQVFYHAALPLLFLSAVLSPKGNKLLPLFLRYHRPPASRLPVVPFTWLVPRSFFFVLGGLWNLPLLNIPM